MSPPPPAIVRINAMLHHSETLIDGLVLSNYGPAKKRACNECRRRKTTCEKPSTFPHCRYFSEQAKQANQGRSKWNDSRLKKYDRCKVSKSQLKTLAKKSGGQQQQAQKTPRQMEFKQGMHGEHDTDEPADCCPPAHPSATDSIQDAFDSGPTTPSATPDFADVVRGETSLLRLQRPRQHLQKDLPFPEQVWYDISYAAPAVSFAPSNPPSTSNHARSKPN